MANHILNALESIVKAQREIDERVTKHDKILESQGRDIASLERQVLELRNKAIQAEITNGQRTDDVAKKYGVTSARISQIAPRRGHKPSKPSTSPDLPTDSA
jgi:Mg2+ and Co2+ transporter CorA